MQDGRFSTIRFNEWICITAQYEKAVARLGRQVYQAYSKGLVTDYGSIEMCKEISETFAEAKKIRAEMEEELERDALDGLNVQEAKKADEIRKLTQAQKTQRTVKLKLTQFMGKAAINRSLATHRDRVKELSRDLGLRALNRFEEEPVIKVRGHKALCRLANQLNDDADKKWSEIVESNKDGGGLSFHTILINFVANFASFSKNTHLGKFLLKFFKYNEKEEQEKLSKQYEGSTSADALREQMAEVEEPSLDVGREIDNMQQEFEENPEVWAQAEPEDWNAPVAPSRTAASTSVAAPTFQEEPAVEQWAPQADTWDPDHSADDEFLEAVADAPFVPAAPTPIQSAEPDPAPTRPTLLRKKPEPELQAWGDDDSGGFSAPKNLPQGGSTPSVAKNTDDWGWGGGDTDGWSATPEEPPARAPAVTSSAFGQQPDPFNAQPFSSGADTLSAPSPTLGTSGAFSTPPAEPFPSAPEFPMSGDPFGDAESFMDEDDPFGSTAFADAFAEPPNPPQPPPQPEPQPAEGATSGILSKTTGSRPPFVKTPSELSTPNWGQQQETKDPTDYGWGTAGPSSTPATERTVPAPGEHPASPSPAPTPRATTDGGLSSPIAEPPAPPVAPASPPVAIEASDPLLKLLRTGDSPSGTVADGDDLLPAFLRERTDDDQVEEDDTFIPELPSFLAADDGPSLEIVPFGSKTQNIPPEEEEDEPFIPEMP